MTGPASASSPAYREVELTSRTGATRSARVFGAGPVAVVLSHMGRGRDDQDAWAAFAELLARRGYQVLTYTHVRRDVWQDVFGSLVSLMLLAFALAGVGALRGEPIVVQTPVGLLLRTLDPADHFGFEPGRAAGWLVLVAVVVALAAAAWRTYAEQVRRS